VIRAGIRLLFICLASLGALLLVVTFTPVVKMMAAAMAQEWHDGSGQVLVVLGGSMLVPGPGPMATLGDDTYLRCVYAVWILRTERYRYVVVSGAEGLAANMARFLTQNGVPADLILQEDAARSTYQNALYTKLLLQKKYGPERVPQVVVLTSEYHSWRARRTFKRCGLRTEMIPIPDIVKRSSSLKYRWTAGLTLLNELLKDGYYVVTGQCDLY